MGKLTDDLMENFRRAQAISSASGDHDLANQLAGWLENMERELAEDAPEPTVTLYGFDFKNPYRFKSITRIEKPWPHTVVYGRSDDFCAGEAALRIAESPAEATAAARAVWPEFDCEGAEPRLQPTVTLTRVGEGDRCRFSRIETIRQDVQVPSGRPFCAISGDYEVNGEAWLSGHTCVRQTAAAVTIVAREAWGPDWSCPGAEPPVVVLHSQQKGTPIVFTKIIAMPANGCPTLKGIVHGHNDGNPVHIWYELEESHADIIALCAEKGVPCPPEEKPEEQPVVGVSLAAGTDYANGSIVHIRPDGTVRLVPDPQVAKLQKRVDGLELAATTAREAWVGEEARADNAEKRVKELEAERFELLDERGNLKSRLGGRRKRVRELDELLVSSAQAFDAAIADFNDEMQRVMELEAEATLRAETLQQTVTSLHQAWRERDRLKGVEKDLVGAHLALERMLDKSEERVEELEAEVQDWQKGHGELAKDNRYWHKRAKVLHSRHTKCLAELNAALRRHDEYVVQAVDERDDLQEKLDEVLKAKPDIGIGNNHGTIAVPNHLSDLFMLTPDQLICDPTEHGRFVQLVLRHDDGHVEARNTTLGLGVVNCMIAAAKLDARKNWREPCPGCLGTGTCLTAPNELTGIQTERKCPDCNGTGQVNATQKPL